MGIDFKYDNLTYFLEGSILDYEGLIYNVDGETSKRDMDLSNDMLLIESILEIVEDYLI